MEQPLTLLIIEQNPREAGRIGALLVDASARQPTLSRLVLNHVTHPSEARAALDEDPADVVLLSLHEGHDDPLESLRNLQSELPAVPIILLNGHSDEAFALSALRAGAADYLSPERLDSRSLLHAVAHTIQRGRIQGRLAESDQRYRRLAERLPDLIYRYRLASPHGFEYVNSAAQRITGYTPEEHYADPDLGWKIVHPEDRPVVEAVARGELVDKSLVLRWVRKDGSVVWIEQRNTVIVDDAGIPVAIEGIARDITERKQAEEALRQANLDLEQRIRELTAKDEFLATMSHELRTPLNAILGLSEILLEQVRGPLNNRQVQTIHNIEASGQHLLALINDLLDLSKIEAGKIELQCETMSVNAICQSSLSLVREAALKKELQVSYDAVAADLCVVADPRRLKQMLVNLLSNAVKFTPAGGSVTLSVVVHYEARQINFAVQDTGTGIAPAAQTRLFQPFVQLETALPSQNDGTGLGLALVKRLAEHHGGSVTLVSSGIPGEGCCFTLTLPYEQPEAAVQQGLASAGLPWEAFPPVEIALARPLVLLVEDNRLNGITVQEFLEWAGYEVLLACTGPEALAIAQTQRPSLFLVDIRLPGLDGLEVMRRLRAQACYATTPIIALTASAMRGDRERCLEAGASEYMSKPLSMKALAALMARLLSEQC